MTEQLEDVLDEGAITFEEKIRGFLHARDAEGLETLLDPLSLSETLREVLAQDVRMTIHRLPPAGRGEADAERRLFDLGGLSGLGLGSITRVLVTGISVEISRGGTVEFRIAAERARVRSRRGQLDLLGGVWVSSSSGERVGAREARLLDGGQRLRVWGPYEWQREGETRQASDAFFSLGAGGALRLAGADP